MDSKNLKLAEELVKRAKGSKYMLATAESCTGGLISAYITSVSGSSEVLDRGFVTYSNNAKIQMLRVCKGVLEDFGAVSEQVAKQMAIGAINNSEAKLGVSVTGIAGPTGGTDEKPVGLVYVGIFKEGWSEAKTVKNIFTGDREEIREKTVTKALEMLLSII